ncbi:MAG: YggT family protein [Armatimonadota bacterium]|nr:YggT family protein [Armatimonadota bacterium]MDW8025606.1 YggT family protein [Armatimonadota bacterium]
MFIANLIALIANVLTLLLFVRAVLSWIPSPRVQCHPFSQFVVNVTEPILKPLRKLVPTYKYGIDISPVIAVVLIWIVAKLLIAALTS